MKLLWARNAPFVARFTREAYAAAQLRHENLAQIVDFGESRGTTYFCTEHIEGQNLGELISQKRRLGAEVAASYVLQAARGLRDAHDQSMIHRDIKPENLWLDPQGLVKVADLGLVNSPELAEVSEAVRTGKALAQGPGSSDMGSGQGSITATDAPIGTPGFMAPEQARDPGRVDARADIYSLGCTLYYLVTGRPPFEGRSALEILNKQEAEPVTPPEKLVKAIPGSLSAIILKMMARRPDERFGNFGQVIDALESFLGVAAAGLKSSRRGRISPACSRRASIRSTPPLRHESAPGCYRRFSRHAAPWRFFAC